MVKHRKGKHRHGKKLSKGERLHKREARLACKIARANLIRLKHTEDSIGVAPDAKRHLRSIDNALERSLGLLCRR